MLLTDGGVENVNGAVDELVEAGLLKRVLAQTEITFSNSLIDPGGASSNTRWLDPNALDTVRTIENLVAFYVREHNSRLPHSAFRGQTPDEMFFGTGDKVPDQLEASRQRVRQARAKANREKTCSACETLVVSV